MMDWGNQATVSGETNPMKRTRELHPLWVKSGKPRTEHFMSAFHPV